MNEIDWSKAPEDADKYNTHNSMFYKGERPYLQVFIHEQWKPSVIKKSNELFVYRPATPPWSGEGLPPVGVVCEYMAADNLWIECEVVAHRNNAAIVIDNGYDCALVPARELRPILTPEQIAADELEEAIEQIVDIIAGFSYRRCAELIHGAGYRKP